MVVPFGSLCWKLRMRPSEMILDVPKFMTQSAVPVLVPKAILSQWRAEVLLCKGAALASSTEVTQLSSPKPAQDSNYLKSLSRFQIHTDQYASLKD
ncbi:hypothetical protein EK904_006272 [Melospiza melodia maxima]|nr:hypothetical protein EK904_006272 [Melospiza melodia maxima]